MLRFMRLVTRGVGEFSRGMLSILREPFDVGVSAKDPAPEWRRHHGSVRASDLRALRQ